MTNILRALSVAILLSSTLALAQGTYAQIDYPGATYTDCWSIDSAGDIAGSYALPEQGSNGFFLSNGLFTTIAYAGYADTYLMGMNDVGQIVGAAFSSGDDYVGFVYDIKTQSFKQISYPGATATVAIAINDLGEIVGRFDNGFGTTDAGFRLFGSTYKEILPPEAADAQLFGITDAGQIVGVADGVNGGYFNFVVSAQERHHFMIPNAPGAGVSGVSLTGNSLVGWIPVSNTGQAPFVYSKQKLTVLQPFGSTFSYASGINLSGTVVGMFLDANSATHCFLWTPPAPAHQESQQ